MFDMYRGYAWFKNWDFEVYNYTPAEYGDLFVVKLKISKIKLNDKESVTLTLYLRGFAPCSCQNSWNRRVQTSET